MLTPRRRAGARRRRSVGALARRVRRSPIHSLVYLDGNSLGMMPRAHGRATATRAATTSGRAGLIRSWDHWVDLPQRVGDRLAPLIGAAPGEVVVHDSTTVNLYQLVDAACALRPDRDVIAISPGRLPDRSLRGRRDRRSPQVCESSNDFDRPRRCRRGRPLGRRLPHGSGGRCRRARRRGLTLPVRSRCGTCRTLPACWRSTSAAAGVQLAVGCTYKYLNGGPGAPAFSYVARDLQATLPQPIWGWFAQADQFDMGPTFTPQPDIRRLLLGTPSILALAAAEEGIALTAEAGIAADRRQGACARPGSALDALRPARSSQSITPRDPARRGGHVAVVHPNARSLVTRARRTRRDHRLPRSRHRPHRLLAVDDPLHRRLRRPHPPGRSHPR